MKTKIIFYTILVLGFLTLWGVGKHYRDKYKEQKLETERYQNNFYNSKQTIDSLVTANGDFRYTVKSLQVDLQDLEVYNADLYNKLKKSNLKIKDLEHIVSTQSSYIIQLSDSLHYYMSESGIDTTEINGKYKIFDLQYKDKWLVLDQKIKVSTHGENIEDYWDNINLKQEAFHQELNNDFDIVNELIYRPKKWWQFWKRKTVTGVKSHIITDNPYLKIKTIESYNLIDNKKKK